MIKFYLDGEDFVQNDKNVSQKLNEYTLKYPCSDSHECKNYVSLFPPGKYLIKLYGGSGGHMENYVTSSALINNDKECIDQDDVDYYGGNVYCTKKASMAGAGGFTSGTITLQKTTKVYIAIGGRGKESKESGSCSFDEEDMLEGGYNGGGNAANCFYGTSSGGGATDVRLLINDVWHRILVAGGGGGTDNTAGDFRSDDDGSGGAGGGLSAQGFWVDGNYNKNYIANQISGFTFGNGESAQEDKSANKNGVQNADGNDDRAGAGGGWFGGFASHNGNGGAGGGSSFAFTEDATIPEGNIPYHDTYYKFKEEQPYAFDKSNNAQYLVRNAELIQGIWDGNGKAIIIYFPFCICTNKSIFKMINFILIQAVQIMIS